MKKTVLLIIALTALFSCKQSSKSIPVTVEKGTAKAAKNVQSDKDIYTKYEYTDDNGKSIIIQNGYPKGGMQYTNPNGKVCGYVVLWTNIINETDSALELNLQLPVNAHELSNFPAKYFKVFAPADTMTLDKMPSLMYGLKDIKAFLDYNFDKPSSFKRIIHPKESSGLYFLIVVLTEEATGMTRTGLYFKGQDLFYRISRYSSTKPITLIEEKEIHCGSINLKNLRLQK